MAVTAGEGDPSVAMLASHQMRKDNQPVPRALARLRWSSNGDPSVLLLAEGAERVGEALATLAFRERPETAQATGAAVRQLSKKKGRETSRRLLRACHDFSRAVAALRDGEGGAG